MKVKFIYIILFIITLLTPFIAYFLFDIISYGTNLVITFTVLIAFIFVFFTANKKTTIPSYNILLLLYFIFRFFVSYKTGIIEQKGLFGYLIRDYFIHSILIIPFIMNANIGKKVIGLGDRFLELTIIISFFVSLYQRFVNPFFWATQVIEKTYSYNIRNEIGLDFSMRFNSIYGLIDEYSIGLSFVPIVVVYITKRLFDKQRFDARTAFFYMLSLIIVFFNNSRWVQVGMLFPIFYILNFYRKRLKKNIFPLIISLGVLSIIFFQLITSFFNINMDAFVEERLLSESYKSRFLAFEVFGNFFLDKPLFGTGERVTDEMKEFIHYRSSQVHVGFLSHLLSYGFVGSFLLFGYWFSLLKHLTKRARVSGYWGSVIVFYVFLWANATLVQFNFLTYGFLLSLFYEAYFFNTAKEEVDLEFSRNNLMHELVYKPT